MYNEFLKEANKVSLAGTCKGAHQKWAVLANNLHHRLVAKKINEIIVKLGNMYPELNTDFLIVQYSKYAEYGNNCCPKCNSFATVYDLSETEQGCTKCNLKFETIK